MRGFASDDRDCDYQRNSLTACGGAHLATSTSTTKFWLSPEVSVTCVQGATDVS